MTLNLQPVTSFDIEETEYIGRATVSGNPAMTLIKNQISALQPGQATGLIRATDAGYENNFIFKDGVVTPKADNETDRLSTAYGNMQKAMGRVLSYKPNGVNFAYWKNMELVAHPDEAKAVTVKTDTKSEKASLVFDGAVQIRCWPFEVRDENGPLPKEKVAENKRRYLESRK